MRRKFNSRNPLKPREHPGRRAIPPTSPGLDEEASDVADNRIDNQPAVESLRCDSCGAGIDPGADRCEYCGQVPVIHVKGVKLSVLMKMYLDAGQHQDANDLSSEILKEHPQNAIAWAAKGLSGLHLGSAGIFGMKVLSVDDVAGAIKCFEFAAKFGRGFVVELRLRGAETCMRAANAWRERWIEAYQQNSFIPLTQSTKDTFAWVHIMALSAEKLNPKLRGKVKELLTDIDDTMEKRFNWIWMADDYQEKKRRIKASSPRSAQTGESLGWPWIVLGICGMVYYLFKYLVRH